MATEFDPIFDAVFAVGFDTAFGAVFAVVFVVAFATGFEVDFVAAFAIGFEADFGVDFVVIFAGVDAASKVSAEDFPPSIFSSSLPFSPSMDNPLFFLKTATVIMTTTVISTSSNTHPTIISAVCQGFKPSDFVDPFPGSVLFPVPGSVSFSVPDSVPFSVGSVPLPVPQDGSVGVFMHKQMPWFLLQNVAHSSELVHPSEQQEE